MRACSILVIALLAVPLLAQRPASDTAPQSAMLRAGLENGPLRASAASPAEGAGRRVRVRATLVNRGQMWWEGRLGAGTVDGVLVSWGVTPIRTNGTILKLRPSQNCPQDPFCTGWSRDGGCVNLFMAEHQDWQAAYACYAANRTLFFGQTTDIFEFRLPPTVGELQIAFYYRNGRYERRPWPTRSAPDSPNRGSPGFVKLSFGDLGDLDLQVEIELIASAAGNPEDLRISTCRIDTPDQELLLRRLQGADVRFCQVEPAGHSAAP